MQSSNSFVHDTAAHVSRQLWNYVSIGLFYFTLVRLGSLKNWIMSSWRLCERAQVPVSLTIFAHNSNSMESSLYCNFIAGHEIATNFCTCNDSKAVVPLKKLVTITVLESRWEWNNISIEFEWRWKNRWWNGALDAVCCGSKASGKAPQSTFRCFTVLEKFHSLPPAVSLYWTTSPTHWCEYLHDKYVFVSLRNINVEKCGI